MAGSSSIVTRRVAGEWRLLSAVTGIWSGLILAGDRKESVGRLLASINWVTSIRSTSRLDTSHDG